MPKNGIGLPDVVGASRDISTLFSSRTCVRNNILILLWIHVAAL